MQSRSCCGSIRGDDGRTSYYASVLNQSNVRQNKGSSRNGHLMVTNSTSGSGRRSEPVRESSIVAEVIVVVNDVDDPDIQIERIEQWEM